MADTNECPVCGKSGIPDFRQEDVVCPCCETDLSIYRKLGMLNREKNENPAKKGKHRLILSVLALLVCLISIGCICLAVHSDTGASTTDVNALSSEVVCLKDSIARLNAEVTALQSDQTKAAPTTTAETYVVKRGDSLCKISREIYGTEMRYGEIADLNYLTVTSTLQVGDTLIIPAK